MTEQLRTQQERIKHSYQSLEGLYRVAEAINPVLSEQDVAERALDRVLDLPGVSGATIRLLGLDGGAADLAEGGPVVEPGAAVRADLTGHGLAGVGDCRAERAFGVGEQADVHLGTYQHEADRG